MAYPDDVLVEGERVVLHRHPHWRVLVGPVLVFLAVLGAVGYLAAVIRSRGVEAWGWPVLGGLAAVLVVWLTLLPVVRWCRTDLVVTTRRVLVREGVVRTHGLCIPLDRVAAAHARSTVVGRLVGCGTLVVDTGADGEVEFVDVPGAEHVRGLLTG
jgi:uncharacterized membrane protein YdbT with pleckstrin-like domain